jgi:hypothetical protein
LNTKRLLVIVGIGAAALVVLAISGFIVLRDLGDDVPTDDPLLREAATEDAAQLDDETSPLLVEQVIFPAIEGTDLRFAQKSVPDDLAGEYRLIVVSYDVEQQEDVDEWLEPLEKLNDEYPELAGYYVPLLPADTADNAGFIIGGMSLVAGSDENRERTIVTFTNIDKFNRYVGVDGLAAIQLFLIDENNRILWVTSGRYSTEKLAELRGALDYLRERE